MYTIFKISKIIAERRPLFLENLRYVFATEQILPLSVAITESPGMVFSNSPKTLLGLIQLLVYKFVTGLNYFYYSLQ
jgi:hypothetical protein